MPFRFKKTYPVFTLVAIFFVILFFIFTSQVFSYNDTVTHPSLTQNIAEVYNKNSGQKLTTQEIEWLRQGSIEEDTPMRWMNHFYEPQTDNGLWGFSSSKDWAENELLQSLYPKGNQTWQKAIDSYVGGSKKEAFVALGHVLHLLEDATVPAHTRLDAHPEGDPYERWVYDNIGNQINFDTDIMQVSDLLNAFYSLAMYSNTNFLSKDTIDISGKNILEKIVDKKVYLFTQDNQGNIFRLAEKKIISNEVFYNLDNNVHSDYFSLLAPKAVSYGAGVIKLFFEEAERQKKAEEQKSWWEKIKESLFGAVSTQLTSQPAQEVVQNSETVSQSQTSQSQQSAELAQSSKPIITMPENTIGTIPASGLQPPQPKIQEEVLNPKAPPEIKEKTFSPTPPAGGQSSSFQSENGVGGGPEEESEEGEDEEEELEPEPVSTSTPAAAPEVSIWLSDYSITARQFSIYWNSSSSPAATTTYDIDMKYGSADWQDWEIATSSGSKVFEVPQDETVYYFRAQAENANGTSTWQEISAPINFYPVVINEIAWAGTSASTTADEWIELYNKTDYIVNLSGWLVVEAGVSTTTVVALQDQIGAHSYYLIERTDDTTISDITADLAHSFGGGGFSNSGENLRLVDAAGQIVDIADCSGGWPAGNAAPDYRSMERVNPYLTFDIPGNWQSNSTSTRNGLNVDGLSINGTPRAQNSVFSLEFFYLYPAQDTTATSTKLKWTQSYLSDFKEYRILRSPDSEFNATSTTIFIAATSTIFFDESLESETEYYYKILACDNSDDCIESNSVSIVTPEFPFLWSAPEIISENSTTSDAVLPDIALAAGGQPAVAWHTSTSTASRFINFSKKQTGEDWSEPQSVSENFMPHGYPPQTLSSLGGLEILYSGQKPSDFGAPFDIFNSRFIGGVWEDPQDISLNGFNNFSPAGIIDVMGITHIVWQGLSTTSSSTTAILYRALGNDGAPLAETKEISGSEYGVMPNIILDSENKLRAVWYHCSVGNCDSIWYSVNNQDGVGWSEAKNIFNFSQTWSFGSKPEMLFNKKGKLLVAWEWRNNEIVLAEFDGATTTQKAVFSYNGKILTSPELILSNQKKPYVFWAGAGSSDHGIYFTYLQDNGQWRPVKKVFEDNYLILWPRAVVDSNNILHLVFYGGEGNLKVYYSWAEIE